MTETNNLWVLIESSKNVYALPVNCVFSFFQIDKITPLPKAKAEILGVIKYQGSMIQLIDIKNLFNLKTTAKEIEEFNDLMDARRQDHINWLNTLEDSVFNDKPFTLATDPHKCAFGRWYDSFDPHNGNLMFLTTFARFDKPHQIIHGIAIKAEKLLKENKKEQAIDLINTTKSGELSKMISLFEELKKAFMESKKELAAVIGNSKNTIALAVDEIVSVEELFDVNDSTLESINIDSGYITSVAKRKSGQVVFILNHEVFLQEYK